MSTACVLGVEWDYMRREQTPPGFLVWFRHLGAGRSLRCSVMSDSL